MKNILEVKNLHLEAKKTLVKDVSFTIRPGEMVGIVGESGSGKSMTALSVMGLLPDDVRKKSGEIYYMEKKGGPRVGKEISMIFQEPMTSLNPVLTIEKQLEEMLLLHEKHLDKDKRRMKIEEMLAKVELPAQVLKKYPHQLSGGMRQRVMIAMAMICHPNILIADEPTTALDAKVQEQILKLLVSLSKDFSTAVLLISHDIHLVHRFCHHVFVMKEGEIVERGDTEEVFHSPKHEYTKKLLASLPTPKEAFSVNEEVVLEINHLKVGYADKEIFKNVSFQLKKGEILGIMGDSGCGKSTLSQTIVGLIEPKEGEINDNGHSVGMVFQDPYSSLNPAKTVGWILEEPLRIQKVKNRVERKKRVEEMLEAVGFSKEYALRRVDELSGGQRQRVAIALALIVNPEIVILDEPVSALDVTIQDKVCKLLLRCKEQFDLSYIFISHDKAVMEMMCDRILIMKEGKIYDN